jgi:DNA-binding response OmpR family regulator
MSQPPLVLVVDDEEDVRDLIRSNLIRSGFRTIEAGDGESALECVRTARPDAVILDIMMPKMDGFTVCEEIRKDPVIEATPVIMLTAKILAQDRVTGLEKGADDYVPKPFSPRELVLRIQALLKRATRRNDDQSNLTVGPFHFDLGNFELTVDGQPTKVTLVEFKLLRYLALRPGIVVDRNEIMQKVWSYGEQALSRTVDTHVRRLREKLGGAGNWVETVHGEGYRFQKPGEE